MMYLVFFLLGGGGRVTCQTCSYFFIFFGVGVGGGGGGWGWGVNGRCWSQAYVKKFREHSSPSPTPLQQLMRKKNEGKGEREMLEAKQRYDEH